MVDPNTEYYITKVCELVWIGGTACLIKVLIVDDIIDNVKEILRRKK